MYLFYLGIRTETKGYTCPLLAVHTSHKSTQNVETQQGTLDTVTGTLGFMRSDTSAALLTSAAETKEYKVDVDEDIRVIPVEDIISIGVSSGVKKALEEKKSARRKEAPREERGCLDKQKCCSCLPCCKEPPVEPEYETVTTHGRKARRSITITIKHVRHSEVHTPSNVEVLPEEEKAKFYLQLLAVDTTKFYYLNDDSYDEAKFKRHLKESETLARIVMQLKAMKKCYPDDSQLEKIIQQHYIHQFGEAVTEDISFLQGGKSRVTSEVVKYESN